MPLSGLISSPYVCAHCSCAVNAKDRIAQLILERIVTPAVEEVETLPDTARGAGGFGSTGTH